MLELAKNMLETLAKNSFCVIIWTTKEQTSSLRLQMMADTIKPFSCMEYFVVIK